MRFKPFLCRVGIHRWRWTPGAAFMGGKAHSCQRCGAVR